jgi:hypothetical protein
MKPFGPEGTLTLVGNPVGVAVVTRGAGDIARIKHTVGIAVPTGELTFIGQAVRVAVPARAGRDIARIGHLVPVAVLAFVGNAVVVTVATGPILNVTPVRHAIAVAVRHHLVFDDHRDKRRQDRALVNANSIVGNHVDGDASGRRRGVVQFRGDCERIDIGRRRAITAARIVEHPDRLHPVQIHVKVFIEAVLLVVAEIASGRQRNLDVASRRRRGEKHVMLRHLVAERRELRRPEYDPGAQFALVRYQVSVAILARSCRNVTLVGNTVAVAIRTAST